MAEQLEAALAEGAVGLSTGLAYPTAKAAPMEEVLALAERLKPYGGIYTTHMRNEGDRVVESVEESLETGRRAGVPIVISHHKATGRKNWGRTRATLALIEQAGRQQKVHLDVYPYTASSTVLLLEHVRTAEKVIVTWSEAYPDLAGKDLGDIAKAWGCSTAQAVSKLQPAGAIYEHMHADDLQRVLSFPQAMIGSDGLPHDVFPHPRLWGSFPRVLGFYSRESQLFSLEEAVRRMTGLTAEVFGLKNRGTIREGAFADLVVFNPETIQDVASFKQPKQPATGVERVIVGGQLVWDQAVSVDNRPGRLLTRTAGD